MALRTPHQVRAPGLVSPLDASGAVEVSLGYAKPKDSREILLELELACPADVPGGGSASDARSGLLPSAAASSPAAPARFEALIITASAVSCTEAGAERVETAPLSVSFAAVPATVRCEEALGRQCRSQEDDSVAARWQQRAF